MEDPSISDRRRSTRDRMARANANFRNGITGVLKQAHIAAENKKWGDFIESMEGPFAKRKERLIQVLRTWSDEPNRYQEPKGDLLSET